MIGKTLSHFEITAKLGEGGMGEVYRATDTKLGREVAIKVLPEKFVADEERLARFEREARVLASLSHPNIAGIHEVGEEGEVHFLVMELVEGETLAERTARGPTPVGEVIEIGLQIADGLEVAHEQAIVHRDLKPANVKLTSAGRVKILDFGLAKALEPEPAAGSEALPSQSPTLTAQMTKSGTLLGTAGYMSPEQARGQKVDGRTDVWAFGAVLFEMLAGRRAFGGDTAIDTTTAVLSSEPDWDSLPSSTPPTLRRLLLWCLRKDVRQRLQHIGDGRILLAELRGQGPLADRGPGPTAAARAISWKLALPGALALLLTGAALAWLADRSDVQPTTPPAPSSWDLRPLTATGDAWNVGLSPSGETVTYLSSDGLVTQDTSGGDPNLILADPGWGLSTQRFRLGQPHGEPRWLFDGSSVAFTVPIDSTTLGISAVPRMGGAVQPLFSTQLKRGENNASLQSLDADSFLLARTLESKRAAPWIRWIEAGVEEGIDLPEDVEDLWDAVGSPQAAWVAYIGERADRTTVVATVSRDGARHNVIVERRSELSKWQEMSLTRHWAGNRIMRWPEGNRLYYREMSTRGLDVYSVAVDLDSGKALGPPELIYSGLPPGASFDVASDGRRMAYSGGVIKTQIRVFRFDRERGQLPVEDWQVTAGTARHVAPRVSPDGQRIAYLRKTRGSDDIYIAPLAGGEAEPLYVLYKWTRLIDLKWAPEGDELVVFADTGTGAKLLRISLSDSRVTEIPTRPPRGTWFDLSPDGKSIAYGIRDDAAYVVHELATGEELEFSRGLEGERIQALFSPDGSKLVVNNIGQVDAGLWRATLDGAAPKLVTAEASGRTHPVRWSRDGALYILGEDGALSVVEASGGSLREFGRIPETPVWDGWASVHLTDSDLYLVCAVDEPRESDVWIMDRVE